MAKRTKEGSAELMKRGMVFWLYPSKRQKKQLDTWRRDLIQLWNLLVGFQKSLYSGESFREELKWRQLIVEILSEHYRKDLDIWLHGRPAGQKRSAKAAGKGNEPQPPSRELIRKIIVGKIDGQEPHVFVRERVLLALIVRLKKVGRSQWIGTIPSHATQRVAIDLELALAAMIREKKRRAKGHGLNTGFPKKKKISAYAAGSIYFANTQLRYLNVVKGYVTLPNGLGKVRLLAEDRPRTFRQRRLTKDGRIVTQIKHGGIRGRRKRFAEDTKLAALQGGRIYRRGESWCLAVQYFMPRPTPLPRTGKAVGVHLSASVMATTYDGRTYRQYDVEKIEPRLRTQYRLAGQRQSRRLEAQKRAEKSFLHRLEIVKENHSELAGRLKLRKKYFRLRRSKGFFEAAGRLAELAFIERKRRANRMHQVTTELVRNYDMITVQEIDVAGLLRKEMAKESNGKQQKNNNVRSVLHRAGMAMSRQTLEYKAADYGRYLNTIPAHYKSIQGCAKCGTIVPEMKLGRKIFKCPECGNVRERRKNAAENSYNEGLKIANEKKVVSAENVVAHTGESVYKNNQGR